MHEVILAVRYLLRRRITYFAVLAVTLCVFIVAVVMTVMTGLLDEFKQKNHSFVGDCVIGTESLVGFPYYEDFGKILEGCDFVEAVSPVIKSYALISQTGAETGRNEGVEIMGVEPGKHSRVTNFGRALQHHKDDASKAFEPAYDPNLEGFIIGYDLFTGLIDANYDLVPRKRSFLVSCFPLTAKGTLARAGTDMVNTKTFYYSDSLQSGLARADGSMLYLPFEQSQLLCGMSEPVKRASCIYIKFRPGVKLDVECEKVSLLWRKFAEGKRGLMQANLLDKVKVQSWKDYRRAFIAPVEKEQVMMIVMFGLVGITTVFIIFVVFYMIVSHKSKDIGVLKSIGVSNMSVLRLFCGFALLIGFLSSCMGLLGGWLFLLEINRIEGWLFKHFGFQLWDRTIYAIGDIPNRMGFGVAVVIALSAIIVCLAGAFLPSRQAAKLNPVETLRVSQL
jgi:lipoprotein-releasing system permease protein